MVDPKPQLYTGAWRYYGHVVPCCSSENSPCDGPPSALDSMGFIWLEKELPIDKSARLVSI